MERPRSRPPIEAASVNTTTTIIPDRVDVVAGTLAWSRDDIHEDPRPPGASLSLDSPSSPPSSHPDSWGVLLVEDGQRPAQAGRRSAAAGLACGRFAPFDSEEKRADN
jgi:hypothetical protein